MRKHKGFTLVEILIVVVILGILAAIVIPQFSDASTQSKVSSSLSSLQSLRSQIQLYKIQHNDEPPAYATFAAQMTQYSDAEHTTAPAKDTTNKIIYGPYVQSVPANPWNNFNTVSDAAPAADNGWVYYEDTGAIYLDITGVTNTEVRAKLIESGAVDPSITE